MGSLPYIKSILMVRFKYSHILFSDTPVQSVDIGSDGHFPNQGFVFCFVLFFFFFGGGLFFVFVTNFCFCYNQIKGPTFDACHFNLDLMNVKFYFDLYKPKTGVSVKTL